MPAFRERLFHGERDVQLGPLIRADVRVLAAGCPVPRTARAFHFQTHGDRLADAPDEDGQGVLLADLSGWNLLAELGPWGGAHGQEGAVVAVQGVFPLAGAFGFPWDEGPVTANEGPAPCAWLTR